jgi:hypothetical protein
MEILVHIMVFLCSIIWSERLLYALLIQVEVLDIAVDTFFPQYPCFIIAVPPLRVDTHIQQYNEMLSIYIHVERVYPRPKCSIVIGVRKFKWHYMYKHIMVFLCSIIWSERLLYALLIQVEVLDIAVDTFFPQYPFNVPNSKYLRLNTIIVYVM